MYELLCRSVERPWASKPEQLDCVPETSNPAPFILHMQENCSHLSQDARVCFIEHQASDRTALAKVKRGPI